MNLPNGLSPYLLHPYSSAAVPTFPPNHPYPAAAPPDCSYASMDGLDCSDYFNPSSDYLMPAMDDDSSSSFNTTSPTQMDSSAAPANSFFSTASGDSSLSSSDHMSCNGDLKRTMEDVGCRIAFRTRSELEVMDDGYKWRKYGKKAVKNSPNPRNYYKCARAGCDVKKRVERDREDPSYVITTYEGVHNHESPCVVCYKEMPLVVPSGWTLQAYHSSQFQV